MSKVLFSDNSSELPDSWDKYAENYFQTKKFLNHTERYNPSRQRYYYSLDSRGELRAGGIVYNIREIFLKKSALKPPVPINMCNVPCAVPESGFFGASPKEIKHLLEHILSAEDGLTAGYNFETRKIFPGNSIPGITYPAIILKNRFGDFSEYISFLSSNNRRRHSKVARRFKKVKTEIAGCYVFSPDMYNMYLDTFTRNKVKFGKLPFGFFKNLPGEFRLTSFYRDKTNLGWHICLHYNNCFYFFLGGVNYRYNGRYCTYFNILFDIINQGINQQAELINLGQTAATPKLRTGAEPFKKIMFIYHPNLVIRQLFRAGRTFWARSN